MDYECIDGPDGLEIRVPRDEEYRSCSVCGGHCEPEPSAMEGIGVRFMFVCTAHGAQSIVDPFNDLR